MITDTHKAVEKLISTGNDKENAEAIVELINSQDANLLTKADIIRLENQIQLLEAKFDKDLSELKSKLKENASNLKSDFKQDTSDLKSDIISWAIPTVIGVVSLNIAILGTIIALWFKV